MNLHVCPLRTPQLDHDRSWRAGTAPCSCWRVYRELLQSLQACAVFSRCRSLPCCPIQSALSPEGLGACKRTERGIGRDRFCAVQRWGALHACSVGEPPPPPQRRAQPTFGLRLQIVYVSTVAKDTHPAYGSKSCAATAGGQRERDGGAGGERMARTFCFNTVLSHQCPLY